MDSITPHSEESPSPADSLHVPFFESHTLPCTDGAARASYVLPAAALLAAQVQQDSRPNPQTVSLQQIMESDVWRSNTMDIPLVLGNDGNGKPVIADLANMPHALIAGAIQSGKSACINTLLMSLLFKFSPNDLKLILVDPVVVDLIDYKALPHLITPIINQPDKVLSALRWVMREMDKRYEAMAALNNRAPGAPETHASRKMPYIIIVINELADLMLTASKNAVEEGLVRLAQKGHAVGIHILAATQRPNAAILTDTIKASVPTRIVFKVADEADARVILDQSGAERLRGQGDMLFTMPGITPPERLQGAQVNNDAIQKVVSFVCSQRAQHFVYTDADKVMNDPEGAGSDWEKYVYPGDTPDVRKALEILFRDRKISTSYIQRCLGIGYNKAAEIMDVFEKRGIVGPQKDGGSKRDILIFDELNQRDS